jgi:hypothetical protein
MSEMERERERRKKTDRGDKEEGLPENVAEVEEKTKEEEMKMMARKIKREEEETKEEERRMLTRKIKREEEKTKEEERRMLTRKIKREEEKTKEEMKMLTTKIKREEEEETKEEERRMLTRKEEMENEVTKEEEEEEEEEEEPAPAKVFGHVEEGGKKSSKLFGPLKIYTKRRHLNGTRPVPSPRPQVNRWLRSPSTHPPPTLLDSCSQRWLAVEEKKSFFRNFDFDFFPLPFLSSGRERKLTS